MANINPREIAYRQMLINLNKLITAQELSVMKFQCKVAGIGDRNRDKIQSTLDLWEKLEERKLLGIDNLAFLKQLLEGCTDNRRDVLDVVSQFEKYRHADVHDGRSGGQEDVNKEVNFLVENLGRDWKFFMRALGLKESSLEMCVESHPRNVREQIHMAFSEWRRDGKQKKSEIIRALKEVHRNDLLRDINSGKVY
uniref:FAS-associated death domain protein-like protein n=1 Tax=Littorina littorea TaxID=31216 RepID=A0A7G8Z9W2_LITLI|nr:FAS-associated death domain protein-like protein [Littorina littorea]